MPGPDIRIEPSILSGDFGRLANEAKRLESSGSDGIHIDVMDGHFVPNLTLGPQAVRAIRKATGVFLDVHLMIYNPFDYIETFVAAGADQITIHFEATEAVQETLEFIRRCGKKAGLAFRPETPFSLIPSCLQWCDLVLIMTVNPGFGGQSFLPDMLEKIHLTRQMFSLDIQVDGGINPQTALQCKEAGANVFVSGDYVFKAPDLAQAIQSLRGT